MQRFIWYIYWGEKAVSDDNRFLTLKMIIILITVYFILWKSLRGNRAYPQWSLLNESELTADSFACLNEQLFSIFNITVLNNMRYASILSALFPSLSIAMNYEKNLDAYTSRGRESRSICLKMEFKFEHHSRDKSRPLEIP